MTTTTPTTGACSVDAVQLALLMSAVNQEQAFGNPDNAEGRSYQEWRRALAAVSREPTTLEGALLYAVCMARRHNEAVTKRCVQDLLTEGADPRRIAWEIEHLLEVSPLVDATIGTPAFNTELRALLHNAARVAAQKEGATWDPPSVEFARSILSQLSADAYARQRLARVPNDPVGLVAMASSVGDMLMPHENTLAADLLRSFHQKHTTFHALHLSDNVAIYGCEVTENEFAFGLRSTAIEVFEERLAEHGIDIASQLRVQDATIRDRCTYVTAPLPETARGVDGDANWLVTADVEDPSANDVGDESATLTVWAAPSKSIEDVQALLTIRQAQSALKTFADKVRESSGDAINAAQAVMRAKQKTAATSLAGIPVDAQAVESIESIDRAIETLNRLRDAVASTASIAPRAHSHTARP